MKFELYSDVNMYYGEVMDLLMEYEIQNNLIIANCLRGKEGAGSAKWFMATIKDANGAVRLAALMTPPRNILLYEPDSKLNNEAVDLLVKEIVHLKIEIPGVLAEKGLAARFAESYSSFSGQSVKEDKKMRIYRLDKVNDISLSQGRFRRAGMDDLFYLPYWNIAFNLDCGMEAPGILDAVTRTSNYINNNSLFVWEDGIPVSQGAMVRKAVNGAVVGLVYTPPQYRGKGYAASCIASLSQKLLNRGFKFCTLFTDLANPISNSIYMKIGYKPVCDFDEYMFV